MKRICSLWLIILALCLGGCSAAPAATQDTFHFLYNGLTIELNTDAAPVIAALGDPVSYTEEQSCAFEGLDKTYFYGSFYLSTYPLAGRDYVYRIWFTDDTVSTAEGIRIGASRSDVEALCGADCFRSGNSCTLTKGDTRLTILLTDETVSSIQYSLISE